MQSADGTLKIDSDGDIEMDVGAAGVKIVGTTPKLTIGDAGAEDTMLVFDGNAQDFRIGLDDGTDNLEIGVGSTHGSTTAVTIDENQITTFPNATAASAVGTAAVVMTGGLSVGADLIVGDDLSLLTDSAVINMGAGNDFSITHDGSTGVTIAASAGKVDLIAGAASSLKTTSGHLTVQGGGNLIMSGTAIDMDSAGVLALDGLSGVNVGVATSGVAISIGHAVSEVTVNDNLTITGDLTVNGSTVTVDATNLAVKDPVITLNQGGQALNANGGLLFTSGSSAAAKPGVAFGRVANDTWAIGQIAVPSSGTMTTVAGMDAAAMTFRAGKFELDGTADYMELDTNVKVVAAVDIILDPGGNNVLPGSDAADDLGSAAVQWKDLYVHGIGYIDQIGTDADPVAGYFNAGELDGVIIGGESAAAGSFTAIIGTTGVYSGILKTDDATEATTTTDGSLQTDGGLSVAKSAVVGIDLDMLKDGGIVNFGADKDVNLTHVHNGGLLLNGAMALQFGDANTRISQAADGVLHHVADVQHLFDGGGSLNTHFSGSSRIGVGDNSATAFAFQEGANSLFAISTANGAEVVRSFKLFQADADIKMSNNSAAITVADSQAAALTFKNVSGASFLVVDTANNGVGTPDNIGLTAGNTGDLNLSHNGTNSQIVNATGILEMRSSGGNLVLSSSAANSEIQFGDAYSGTKLANGMLQLADSVQEYTDYVSNFANDKSLIGALNSLASGGTRGKFQVAITGSHIANTPLLINAALDHDAGTGGAASLDVFVNGQLLTSGTSIANGDYKIGIADIDKVQFFFQLESGDQVTVVKP
jgi:hypothetical protein